ncbi:motile sperm domain-containing protein 2-like [Venturia canescens]|uniref:motile sperm domain-containing protein 2-like n=1 Tax=Venturia canescens TaxID=32260 RepID=UPI001C9C1658|nr:motile sperm domain-containing protein 2-like [Venturia canescens]
MKLNMDVQQQIVELREKFFKKLEDENISDERFHPLDISRIKSQDDWLKRYLEHNEYNIQESLNMLWMSTEWRKKVGANDITEDNVKREYLEDGVFFGYGKDKDGKTLFIIKSKLHTKGGRDFGELQRCIIYWFERLQREGNGDQISLFFDMVDAGLSNMDMELTKYLIGLFKDYYPNFLNYIIILEMPWVLNAAFKIIKSWLPAKAIPKIKFVNKANLKEFVDPADALKCWGGTNDYVFSFVPETRSGGPVTNGQVENKKVHFEGSPLTEDAPGSFGDQNNEDNLLSITPDVISMMKVGTEIVGTIALKNLTTDKHLSYKIKTTAPEKFRVRRSTGTLSPGQSTNVTVTLQTGYNLRTLLQNKFLVMCVPMKDPQMTTEELAEFWKTGSQNAELHRIWCRDGMTEPTSILSSNVTGSERSLDTLFTKMSKLEENQSKLHKDLVTMKNLLLLSILLTIFAAVSIVYILGTDVRELAEEQSCHIHRG